MHVPSRHIPDELVRWFTRPGRLRSILQSMLVILPGLLSSEEWPAFFDPDWDRREDHAPARYVGRDLN